jgi:Carboxypeptidase regulatory-like domain
MIEAMQRYAYFILMFLAYFGSAVPVSADICVYKPPVVRRVAGIVVDTNGQPVPNTTVTVFQDEASIAESRTDENGGFGFLSLKAGVYLVTFKATGFQTGSYRVTLRRPNPKDGHALRVEIIIGSIHCGGDIKVVANKNLPKVR